MLVFSLSHGCGAASPMTTSVFGDAYRTQPISFLKPNEINAILQNSSTVYRVVENMSVPEVAPTEVLRAHHPRAPQRLDPFLEVEKAEGKLILRSRMPEGELRTIFRRAGEAFARQNYELARRLYAQAILIEPQYFKGYTYLGNTLHFLGRFVEAQSAFRRALKLNPYDYQANLFLGDTLHQLGAYSQAKHALTLAYILNPENPVVTERLKSTLAKLSMSVRRPRILPTVSIEAMPEKEVRIYLDREEGDRWLAFASCMACWEFEKGCQGRATANEDPLRLSMYRECLLNHVASTIQKMQSDKIVQAEDQILFRAVQEGYLEAIVFWEVIASRSPAIISLLPEELRSAIASYIQRYVFISTHIVRYNNETEDFYRRPLRELAYSRVLPVSVWSELDLGRSGLRSSFR